MTLILASISLVTLLPIVVFAGVFAIAWLVMDLTSNKKGGVEDRLDMLSDTNAKRERNGKREASAGQAMSKVLEAAAPALAKPLTPQTEKEAGKLKQRLVEAGFRTEGAWMMYLSIKIVVAGLLLVATGGTAIFFEGFTTGAGIKAVVGGGLGFYGPEIVLSFLGSRRKKLIFQGLPDALDLLVVCVEAGLGLDQALRKVAEEMKTSYRLLSDEFSLCNLHLQMGRQRSHVLQDLGIRTGVDDLRSLASLLIQADKFGSSVAQALRVQSDAMRLKRQQIAEEKAAKTAVKLILPLVIFIFPGVFVVLVGPAAVQMVTEMFPAMQGK
ncbi:MAG: type II secretion system F family protein [Pirellulaceae bacterium]|nr:type II secretion system F family protein [Pirellulaceae bacterium]